MAITEEMVSEYQKAKTEAADAKARFEKLENELCQEMLVSQAKTVLVDVHGQIMKVTIVVGETLRVDEKAMEKKIGKRAFKKVCSYKVNRVLLEKALMDPAFPLSPVTAEPFISIANNKPYVRLSKYVEGEE